LTQIIVSIKIRSIVIKLTFVKFFGNDETKEDVLKTGLVKGHAYIITNLFSETGGEKRRLVRLRNPWGKTEWNGDWSDESPCWSTISAKVKSKLDLKSNNDGDFWMSYEDWLVHFDTCEICNLSPDSLSDVTEKDLRNNRDLSVNLLKIQLQLKNKISFVEFRVFFRRGSHKCSTESGSRMRQRAVEATRTRQSSG
jgi:hypothetical protein